LVGILKNEEIRETTDGRENDQVLEIPLQGWLANQHTVAWSSNSIPPTNVLSIRESPVIYLSHLIGLVGNV
jgi:hypothetical protein